MGWRNLVGVQNTCYTAIFLLNYQTDLKHRYYNSFGFEIYIVINFVLVLFVTALKVNMTANIPFPVMFAFFYRLFQRFWLLCRDYERGRYNMNEFHYWQDRTFKKLIAEYKQFRWDEAELD